MLVVHDCRMRRNVTVEVLMRIHFLQHWFNLSDPAVEEALYESVSMREFAGIDLGQSGARRNHDLQVPPPAQRHELGDAFSKRSARICRPRAFA